MRHLAHIRALLLVSSLAVAITSVGCVAESELDEDAELTDDESTSALRSNELCELSAVEKGPQTATPSPHLKAFIDHLVTKANEASRARGSSHVYSPRDFGPYQNLVITMRVKGKRDEPVDAKLFLSHVHPGEKRVPRTLLLEERFDGDDEFHVPLELYYDAVKHGLSADARYGANRGTVELFCKSASNQGSLWRNYWFTRLRGL
jgi:hypothetical protein